MKPFAGTASHGSSPAAGTGFSPAPARTPRPTSKVSACSGSTPPPVHPRACGEQPKSLTKPYLGEGLSPRLRGTAGSVHASISIEMIGSSPRLRGTGLTSVVTFTLGGSSPRLRGTGTHNLDLDHQHRFIPAPAGNRHTQPWLLRLKGSLPRFIPAPAGNSRCQASVSPQPHTAVHPRACGEQFRKGSPNRNLAPNVPVHPRACGEQPVAFGTQAARPRHLTRFIPAPAGNSAKGLVDPTRHRLRFIPAPAGNSSSPSTTEALHIGSSPRLRGTAAHGGQLRDCMAVHPRACGEQHITLAQVVFLRFIPAPAGNR